MTHRHDALRTLEPTHEVHGVQVPWHCATHEDHDCTGTVIGAVGAYPVCSTGYTAQVAANVEDRERIARLLETPAMQRAIREEMRVERWLEARA
jgi:hypothetical protein